jgi:hypothetical protein
MGRLSSRLKKYLELARVARQRTRKSILAQLCEIVQLRLSSGKLGATSYYDYRLFEDRSLTRQQKKEFIDGRIEQKLYRKLNSEAWHAFADDKLVFYSIMRGVGLPHPRIYGIYHFPGRFFEGVPCLSNASELARFLRREIPYPFFSKPVSSSSGRGAAGIVALDSSRDRLLLTDGNETTVDQYVAGLSTAARHGQIFQEYLEPHPVIAEICGVCLSTVRLVVLLCTDGPALLRAFWRIPVGRNMTDNILGDGRSGNLYAHLDLNTGSVLNAKRWIGFDQTEIDLHPDSCKTLTGFAIPNWKETLELCAKAASLLPGLRLQSWDIAICPRGPVIVEVNAHGNLPFLQHVNRKGMYEKWFREAVDRLISAQGLMVATLQGHGIPILPKSIDEKTAALPIH